MSAYIRWYEDVDSGDVATVGGENASLGEMIRNPKAKGIRVPEGFAAPAPTSATSSSARTRWTSRWASAGRRPPTTRTSPSSSWSAASTRISVNPDCVIDVRKRVAALEGARSAV